MKLPKLRTFRHFIWGNLLSICKFLTRIIEVEYLLQQEFYFYKGDKRVRWKRPASQKEKPRSWTFYGRVTSHSPRLISWQLPQTWAAIRFRSFWKNFRQSASSRLLDLDITKTHWLELSGQLFPRQSTWEKAWLVLHHWKSQRVSSSRWMTAKRSMI